MRRLIKSTARASHEFLHGQKPSELTAAQRHPHLQQAAPTSASGIHEPTPTEIMQYRYNHGTNLGSIFVLEKWLHPRMFDCCSKDQQTSELESVRSVVRSRGPDAAKSKFEEHWRGALTDADLDWLVSKAHCTSIRLPIGYFTLGADFCNDTPFAPFTPVYENAWKCVKDLVARANDRGIGTLLDLHALPGGVNGAEHSGTNSGRAEMWDSGSNLDLAIKCLEFVAREAAADPQLDGVIGVQLCNEAERGARGMFEWYDRVLASLSSIDSSMPVYVSDAWTLDSAIQFAQEKNRASTTNPVIVDTHLYWCFDDADKCKSPQDNIAGVGNRLSELDGKEGNVHERGAAQIIVGEYSCVLSQESWDKKGDEDRGALAHRFGRAQSIRFQEKAAGSYFWTFKMDWPPGGEWGFAAQTNSSSIQAPRYMTLLPSDVSSAQKAAREHSTDLLHNAVANHIIYWDRTSPGKQFEHYRFEDGWKLGFADAEAFWMWRNCPGRPSMGKNGADKIGALDMWVRKRMIDAGLMGVEFAWEFEQGLRHGIKTFEELVGLR